MSAARSCNCEKDVIVRTGTNRGIVCRIEEINPSALIGTGKATAGSSGLPSVPLFQKRAAPMPRDTESMSCGEGGGAGEPR